MIIAFYMYIWPYGECNFWANIMVKSEAVRQHPAYNSRRPGPPIYTQLLIPLGRPGTNLLQGASKELKGRHVFRWGCRWGGSQAGSMQHLQRDNLLKARSLRNRKQRISKCHSSHCGEELQDSIGSWRPCRQLSRRWRLGSGSIWLRAAEGWPNACLAYKTTVQ